MASKIEYNYEGYEIRLLDKKYEDHDLGSLDSGSRYGGAKYYFKKYQEEDFYGVDEVAERFMLRDGTTVVVTESMTGQGRAIFKEIRGAAGNINKGIKVYNVTRNLLVEIYDFGNANAELSGRAAIFDDFVMISGESIVHEGAFRQNILELLVGLRREMVLFILTCDSKKVVETMLGVSRVVRSSRLNVIRPKKPRIRVDEARRDLMKLLGEYYW